MSTQIMSTAMMSVAVALAAALASPAFAAKSTAKRHHAYSAYGQQIQPYARHRSRHAPRRSRNVYDESGRYIGSDPDPDVRNMLRRDPSEGGNF
jgi:hypothetical protein